MVRRIAGSALLVLLVGTGIAVAATRGAADSEGVTACVNNTNGLVRIDQTCREGETATVLGGGASGQITYGEAASVPFGTDAAPQALPVTGVALTPRCIVQTGPPEGVIPRMLVSAPAGQTIDVFGRFGGLGVASALLFPVGGGFSTPGSQILSETQMVLVVSPSGSVTLSIGGTASFESRTCTFAWQAVEKAA